jgi:hypothetical protein
LERYAVADARLADALPERYQAVLVVPAFQEAPGLLDRYCSALRSAPGRVLVVVVVNASRARAVEAWPLHAELLSDLRTGDARRVAAAPEAWWARREDCDVLSIDRANPQHCLPDGEGVGLARRIGCDAALRLYAAGRLVDPFLYCTDADAELPAGYFDLSALAVEGVAALTISFWHEPGGDAAIDAATALYELGLRHYVNGLAQAGSPFAFHTLGSALAVRAPAYAAVRGFPQRLAGEDFYLLNKLAKVGLIERIDRAPIRLQSRASQRTAHGTGVAAVKLAAEGTRNPNFYHPDCFRALGAWLLALDEFAQTRQLEQARRSLGERSRELGEPLAAALEHALQELDAWRALREAAAHCRAQRALEVRLHTWFDAFRTLKLVHALRRQVAASLPFRAALAASGAVPRELAEKATVDDLRHWLLEAERRSPPWFGVDRAAARTRTSRRS